MGKGIAVRLGPGDRERLEAVVGSGNSPQKHVWRARIVLLSADGVGTMAIQRQTGKGKPTIWRWQARFMAEGVDGLLHDATRPGRKKPLPAATIERVVAMTLAEPPGEATHWTGRAMAKATGISHRSVQRIWAAHGLQPHRVRLFKLSNDPQFAAKLYDVVGLYINPPEHALVLSVERLDLRLLIDRTQPGLPMKRGRCGTMTHDSLVWTPLVRRVGAIILAAMFVSACFPFGKIDMIGHSLIVVALLAIIADDVAAPAHWRRSWLIPLAYSSSLILFLGVYYFAHMALYGTTVL